MTQHCHQSKKTRDNMGCTAEAVCQENFINKTGQPSFRTPHWSLSTQSTVLSPAWQHLPGAGRVPRLHPGLCASLSTHREQEAVPQAATGPTGSFWA